MTLPQQPLRRVYAAELVSQGRPARGRRDRGGEDYPRDPVSSRLP